MRGRTKPFAALLSPARGRFRSLPKPSLSCRLHESARDCVPIQRLISFMLSKGSNLVVG